MINRRDEPAVGNHRHDIQDEKDTEDPTPDIPDWLQNFKANLEDLEKHVPAHIFERENSDSESSTKVVDKSKFRKRYFSFSKTPKLPRILEDQNYEVSMQNTPWRIHSASRKVWWLDNSRSQSSQWGVNLETIIDMLSIWQPNAFNLIRAKQELLWRRKGVYESFSSCRKSRKSLRLTIHWNWANLVNTYHGIIVLQRSIDLRRMVSLRQRYAE